MEYKWTISALDCKVSEDGMTNVVQTIHWRYKGTNDNQVTAETYGAQTVGSPNPEAFTPFDDLTEEIVVGWLEATMDVDAMNTNITKQIELIENPVTVTLTLKS